MKELDECCRKGVPTYVHGCGVEAKDLQTKGYSQNKKI